MKKNLFFIIIVLCLFLCSCGSIKENDGTYSDNYAGESSDSNKANYQETTAAMQFDDGYSSNLSLEKINLNNQRKIIKNASIEATAENVDECYDIILQNIKSFGGYESSKELHASDEFKRLTVVFQVPPENLDAIISYIQDNSNVINCNVTSDDITSQYTDTKIRLDNKKKTLEKYYKYYDQAETMEDALNLQNKIDEITTEIECYEGQLTLWNTLTSQSELIIYIQQVNDPIKVQKNIQWNAISFSTMGKLMYNGFITVSNILVSIFQWILIIIAAGSPLIVIAVVIFLIIRKRKKNKATCKSKKESVITHDNVDK